MELQRTYRGKAEKEAEREERPFPTSKPVERAIVVASMNVGADEEADRIAEVRELLLTAGAETIDVVVQHHMRLFRFEWGREDSEPIQAGPQRGGFAPRSG